MTSRRLLWGSVGGFVLAVAVLWGAIVALDYGPQLGLDLQGGISITLMPDEGQDVTEQDLVDAVDVLRERVNALGVAEPELARQGGNILVQLPGLENQEQAEDVIQRTAVLQFRRVREIVPPGAANYDGVGPPCEELNDRFVQQGPPPDDEEVVLCGARPDPESGEGDEESEAQEAAEPAPEEQVKYVLGPTEVSGGHVEGASASLGQQGGWRAELELDSEGAERFAEVTADLACAPQGSVDRQFAIVLDGRVQSAPGVDRGVECDVGIVGGDAIINTAGQQEAEEIATVLRGGSLPVQLSISQSRAVSPTLGEASLRGGLQAGFIGLALVALYMILLYRGIGLVAVIELAVFGTVVYGLLIVLGNTMGFTLTLAGIAGVVVSVGIAADSSIIYRERYRDEMRAGATIRSAADKAFRRAFRTNLTGNTVSFLAALVLWLLAIGPVRGFAFTHGLSTLVDTLLLATFTRGLFGLLARHKRLSRSWWMGLRAETVIPRLVSAEGQAAPAGAGEAGGDDEAASDEDRETEVEGREP
jgi:protein-export membrane protein SecD